MGIHFQYRQFVWLFLGLVVLSGLFILLLRWKRRAGRRIGDPKLVSKLIATHSANRFLIKFVLVLLAFAFGVVALMNPRKPGGPENQRRTGIDIAVALDVSKSMLATDMAPSRLERAKQFISKLMDAMPDDRIALVLFAGRAYMQMPLTPDHGAAELYVSAASPDAVPQQGTVISEALDMGSRVFNPAEKRFKTIILISDGEDHDRDALPTAKRLAEQGVMINTVGIGSVNGSSIPDPTTGEDKKDESGNVVISKLNEEELQSIATKTNGLYIHLDETNAAVTAMKAQLSQIDRKAYGDVSLMNFTNYYPWFALAALLILLAESMLPERKRARK